MPAFDPAPTFDELLQHADWVRRLARELVLDESRAEDVVQETWIAALERPPADRSNVRGWLATVARNVARGIGRSEGRRERREKGVARAEALASTAEIAERASLQRDLVDRVLALDEPYRSVLLLRYFEDLEPREIARRLGVPVSTVRTRHARGLEKLRAKLDREYGDRASWGVALVELARRADPVTGVATAGIAGGILVNSKLALVLAALVVAIGTTWWMSVENDSSRPSPPLATRDAGLPPGSFATEPAMEVVDVGERIGLAAVGDADRPIVAAPAMATARTVDVLGRPVGGVEIKQVHFHVPFGTPEEYDQHRMPATGNERAGGPDHPLISQLEALPTLRSDEHGVFTYEGGADPTSLLVWQRGRVLVGGGWRALDSDEEEIVLVVAATTTLEGTVVYEDGAPAPKASVQGRASINALDEFPWILRRSFEGRSNAYATTDDRGHFKLVGTPRVRTLELGALSGDPARSKFFRPFDPSRDPGPIELVLMRDADRYPFELVVTGRVVDARGKPAPDVDVHLGGVNTRSGADGSFRLALGKAKDEAQALAAWQNPRFRYDLFAVRPGFQPAVVEGFGIRLGEPSFRENVVLQLGPAALTIAGRVLGELGEPLGGLDVQLLDPSYVGIGTLTVEDLARLTDARGMRARRILTDGEGRFAVDGLSNRTYRLLARGIEERVVLASEPIEAGESDVVLRVSEGSVHDHVRGRVVSQNGRPIAGIEVGLDLGWQTDWGFVFRKRAHAVVTDAAGRFELQRVPKKLACLSIAGPSVRYKVLDTADIIAGVDVDITADVLARFRVELRPGDDADGFEVHDAQGGPLQLEVLRPDGGLAGYRRVPIRNGASGICQVDDSARALVIFAPDRKPRRVPLELSINELNVVVP